MSSRDLSYENVIFFDGTKRRPFASRDGLTRVTWLVLEQKTWLQCESMMK